MHKFCIRMEMPTGGVTLEEVFNAAQEVIVILRIGVVISYNDHQLYIDQDTSLTELREKYEPPKPYWERSPYR